MADVEQTVKDCAKALTLSTNRTAKAARARPVPYELACEPGQHLRLVAAHHNARRISS